MLQLMAGARARQAVLARRDLLKISAMGALGAGVSTAVAAAEQKAATNASARNCIYIFLCGGPSQIDLWDLKPAAPDEIRGPFKPISTNVPGIQIGDLLPRVSQHADKLAIIRSMNHDTQSHDLGILRTLLASKGQLNTSYPASSSDHPSIGSMLSYYFGARGELPPWVVLPRSFMTGDRLYKGQTAGFLGSQYEALDLATEKRGSLTRTRFDLENLDLRRTGQDLRRLRGRRELVGSLASNDLSRSTGVQQLKGLMERAYTLFSSDRIRQVFDVTSEDSRTRERYGMNEYGQSFLLARRLVEADVRMVNLFWTFYGQDGCQFNLWDNHGADTEICGGKNRGHEMMRHDYCCPSFDRAYAALLEDLQQRGLLETTLIVVVGEFGRTPHINKWAGRDHWASCYSAVLAGGGIRGGTVYGKSDKIAGYVADDPVSPFDLHATVLQAMGVTPEMTVPDPTGRPVRVTDGTPVAALFG
ncbi:MAG: DUF1501 domain-containing protein [Planctomycetota bacterium]|nr:DUF1501 domain-containing protein [Planctomycetota bacterium]